MRQKAFATDVFESLDALATNKNRTSVAVIGRTVTKIYTIFDDHFELRSDRSKPRKTMYFSGSIAWNPNRDNLVAATASNGAIYLWDPEISQSLEYTYKAHKQLATKVCFNEFNENIFASGSKDSTVWLYDLRLAEPTICFSSNQDDSIRDIQFCMESKLQDTFVTAGDSGTIRFWDSRKPDKALKEFIAHSSQVYSIALNPQFQSKNLIATAGRDKYIRIWDWSKNTPQFLYTVEMMAIVTRVSWCPDNLWHVACCFAPSSGFVSSDNTIYVWDIRRPFIPFASFDAHEKTCTDMSWPRYNGINTLNNFGFLSCGKDGKLIMNFTENAHRPILYTNSVALDAANLSSNEIVISVPSYRCKSSSTLIDTSDPFRRKVPSIVFTALPMDPSLMEGRLLAYFAQRYKFIGGSLGDICEHNAQVAESIYKDRLAHTWRMISLLCSQTFLSINPQLKCTFLFNNHQNQTASHTHLYPSEVHNSSESKCNIRKRNEQSSGEMIKDPSSTVLISGSLNTQNLFLSNTDFFFGSDELNFGGMNGCIGTMNHSGKRSIVSSIIINISQLKEEAFGLTQGIYNKYRHISSRFDTFDNGKLKKKIMKRTASHGISSVFDALNNEDNNIDLEAEKFDEEKNFLEDGSITPNSTDGNYEGIEQCEDDVGIGIKIYEREKLAENELPERLEDNLQSLLHFDPLPSLKSILEFHSLSGNVQMCATICMVIGEQLVDYKLVNQNQLELWFYAYIELLERLRLWRVSSLFIKTCYQSKISQLSNESTFVKIMCPNCRAVAARPTLRCSNCMHLYNYTCIICEMTVRGIWSSCTECGHGGHLSHMQEWFEQYKICPAIGCGHDCAKWDHPPNSTWSSLHHIS